MTIQFSRRLAIVAGILAPLAASHSHRGFSPVVELGPQGTTLRGNR